MEKLKVFIRQNSKELIIALILAVVAAIIVDPYIEPYIEKRKEQNATDILKNNLNAVAVVFPSDKDGISLGQGSGLFINSNGVLVTNYHVVKGAAKILAKLPSGAFYQAKSILGSDKKKDIAIIQFDAKETPSVKSLGDSDKVNVGDKIFALGAPLGLEGSVSGGVISNPKREYDGQKFIQFTAPISPGNSGGGLFNNVGDVIGITAASLQIPSGEQKGEAQNLNLAVPINLIKDSISGKDQSLTEESPTYYYALGVLADNKQDFDHAIEDYKNAIALDKTYADAYLGLGGDYYEKAQYELEVENYLKATHYDSNNADAFYYLGTAYEDTGQYNNAINAYQHALQIKPAYKDALHDLSLVYLAKGETIKAQSLVPKLMSLDEGWGKELQMLISRQR